MNNKIILVRSSRELVKQGLVGYAWEKVDFSQYSITKDLFEKGFKDINVGRKRKQIKYFFELTEGDIVVVPVSGAIAIGIVKAEKKIYIPNSEIAFSANRIKVDFFQDDKGIVYVPRGEIATNLERRLKIRMSVASLESFRSDIEKIVSKLETKEIYTWNSDMLEKEENAKNNFINELDERLRTEKGLGIAAGGYGLEKLIRDIFEVKGYEAFIPSKNDRPAGEDVDIVAHKEGEFGSKGEKYLIQVKHHRGNTGRTGLVQLIACKDDEENDEYCYKKILITTAKVADELKKEAELHNIIVVEGRQLSEWLFENLDLLSKVTLLKLGISNTPSLL